MKIIIILISAISLLIVGCSKSDPNDRTQVQESTYEKSLKDSVKNNIFSSSAAVETEKDTTRKFIRTAELRFRVDNVENATYKLEDICAQYDGFVTFTRLSSKIDRQTVTAISDDSSLEAIYYTVSNVMTMRVPNTKLDSILKSISLLVDYLDYRAIKADDVGIQILSNQLTLKRVDKYNKKRKLSSNDDLFDKQIQADKALTSNLALSDQIYFSTINLTIYQRQNVKSSVTRNYNNFSIYEPSFIEKIFNSSKNGLHILGEFFVFVSKLWGLAILAVIIYLLYRKFGKKKK